MRCFTSGLRSRAACVAASAPNDFVMFSPNEPSSSKISDCIHNSCELGSASFFPLREREFPICRAVFTFVRHRADRSRLPLPRLPLSPDQSAPDRNMRYLRRGSSGTLGARLRAGADGNGRSGESIGLSRDDALALIGSIVQAVNAAEPSHRRYGPSLARPAPSCRRGCGDDALAVGIERRTRHAFKPRVERKNSQAIVSARAYSEGNEQ